LSLGHCVLPHPALSKGEGSKIFFQSPSPLEMDLR
jgi:hypothetical protein